MSRLIDLLRDILGLRPKFDFKDQDSVIQTLKFRNAPSIVSGPNGMFKVSIRGYKHGLRYRLKINPDGGYET